MIYTDSAIDTLLNTYREKIIPPTIKSPEDLKEPPNDILMSYFMEYFSPNQSELEDGLKNTERLNDLLKAVSPTPTPDDRPLFVDGIIKHDPSIYVAGMIATNSRKTAFGHLDKSLIIADTTPMQYTYPSGKTVQYSLLINERTANTPIFLQALANPLTGEIFVRDNAMRFLDAFISTHDQSHQSLNGLESLKEQAIGIVLGHELCEMELVRSGKVANIGSVHQELAAEMKNKHFLTENGISQETHKLYHLINTNHDENKKNISYVVLEKVFTTNPYP